MLPRTLLTILSIFDEYQASPSLVRYQLCLNIKFYYICPYFTGSILPSSPLSFIPNLITATHCYYNLIYQFIKSTDYKNSLAHAVVRSSKSSYITPVFKLYIALKSAIMFNTSFFFLAYNFTTAKPALYLHSFC